MAQNFLACDREQELLLPPSLREWLPGGHLAWFVLDAVEQLDLTAILGDYRQDGWGRAAFDPVMMVALLLYSYAVGERSSRQIERRCQEDIATRVIAANRAPDHATISRFRVRHERALAGLFGQVLALCARAGMVRAGTIAVDGTKLAGNASLGANRTADGLRAEAERILREAGEADAAEDARFGDRRGDELPGELADPKRRAARIRELLDELEAPRRRAEAEHAALVVRYERHRQQTGKRPPGRPPGAGIPKRTARLLATKVNLTDPDSMVVRHRGALLQGFNAQAAVADGQVIVAARIAADANDSRQLAPMVAAAQDELAAAGVGDEVDEVLADAGYWNSGQIAELEQAGVRTLVAPTGHDPRARKTKPPQSAHADRAARLLRTPEGRAKYRRRQQIVEPVFAHIKHLRGITRFSRRGRHAVEAEWQLIAATHNLLKLFRAPQPAA